MPDSKTKKFLEELIIKDTDSEKEIRLNDVQKLIQQNYCRKTLFTFNGAQDQEKYFRNRSDALPTKIQQREKYFHHCACYRNPEQLG